MVLPDARKTALKIGAQAAYDGACSIAIAGKPGAHKSSHTPPNRRSEACSRWRPNTAIAGKPGAYKSSHTPPTCGSEACSRWRPHHRHRRQAVPPPRRLRQIRQTTLAAPGHSRSDRPSANCLNTTISLPATSTPSLPAAWP
ncbi:hypothetical protein PCL1606_37250 [Pseudomonas chlororaphis]|uniref:Uncharacterized protein n=1 Tax=Pseudomonas chlororaphis TaxID=587753 RepID=A0A0D5Y1L0_9PSED|nr:hypothetical protein PCL1606_37250 [Pseudomonas chlororaphis]